MHSFGWAVLLSFILPSAGSVLVFNNELQGANVRHAKVKRVRCNDDAQESQPYRVPRSRGSLMPLGNTLAPGAARRPTQIDPTGKHLLVRPRKGDVIGMAHTDLEMVVMPVCEYD